MKAPTPQQLARQFIELWQQQMSQMMHNPSFIQAMLDALHAMPEGAHDPADAGVADSAQPGAEYVAQLEYRLRQCEQRLARLEAAAGHPAGDAGARHPHGGKKPA